MANNNRKFTLSLEIDSKTAEQQIKTTAKNINKILEGMGNASDKMTYFKELADYIGQIDQQLGAFRKTHGEDMFNKMFGGLDSGLQKQMQSLFDTTKKELSAVEELQQKIASARKNGASKDEAKALKSEVEALYKNLGRSDEINISNRLGPAKMLEEAENALNGFAAKWKDVNNKIASGFNFGGSGSSANIQNKINELNEAKNSLQKTLDGIKNNKIGDIELPKGDKKQLEFLKKLVSEYKAAKIAKEDFEKRKDTGSDGYAKAMATYVDSAKKLKGAFDSDPDGEKFGNKSFDYMTKELDTYEDAERGLNNFYNNQKTILTKIKALYSSEIQGINNEIDKLSAGPKNQSSTYDELYSKLKKYLDLQKQLDDENISDADYDKASNDINNIEKEIAALGELKGKAKDVKDVFASFNQGEIADNDLFDKLKNTLGIEIPQNAEKAENALKELDNASEKFSDNIADIKKEADAHEENTAAIRQEEAAQEALNQEKKESKTYIDNTAEEAKESAAAIKEAERAQEMLNQEKKEAQDIKTSEEIAQLEKLEAKIKEVTAAVEVKTKAFKEEGDIVGNVVRQEIMALDTLSTYLDSIYVVINSIVDGLNKVNNTKLNSSDMNVSGKSTSKDYALESTLQRANDILGKILTAVSSDESTGQISKALDSAIMELKEAANAIKTNANNIKQDSTDSVKDTSDSSKKNEKTFDQLKNDEISSFEKYKKDVESSVHITDEFKGKLEKLQAELKNTNDVSSLDAWKQSFSALQSEFSRLENASKNVLTGQINSIKKEAKDAMKGLDFDLPTDDSVKRAKLEEIKQGFKEIQIESDICADKVKNNQNVEIAALNKTKQQLLENINAYKKQYGLLNSGGKSGKNYGSTAVIRETTRYNQFQQYADDSDMGFKNSGAFNSKLQEYTNAYSKLITIREKLSSKPVLTDRDVQEFNDAKQAAANYGKELDKMIAKSQKLEANKFKSSQIGSDVNVNDALSRKQALTDFVTGMHDARESTIKFSNDYQECTFKMKNSDGTWTKMAATLDKTSNKMYSTAGEVTKYGTAFEEFVGSLKGEFLKLGRYMMASFGIQEVIQAVRKGVTYIKQIDDALTDLKKVTNETDAGYDRFLQTMSKTAGVVGSTVAELTTMAAEWARLGYSMQEAANLAESTAVLLNVSEFEDATSASEALISTIQAFGYAADDSMHVVDILNEVGNNFAISSDGIATALQDSASALMAGGNSMEEATAMIAAANKVTQDPSKVGAGLRTISLRLRGTEVSKELEELGEDTEGLVSSSKMRDKIKGLTGVDILTDTGAYKSTYDIIKEIAYVWEDMADMDQAALLELMAGKNRSNIMAALLTNVEDLEGAYEKAMDAEGSAYRENEAYLDSIQGRVDLFMNALQTFWMNFISSDMIKGIVDLGTTLIQFLDTAYGKATALGVAFTAFLKITKNVDNFKNAVRSIFSVNSNTSDVAVNTAVTQANTEAKMANVSATNAETEANTAEAASSTVASEADAAETVSSSTASAADTAEAAASSQASMADTVEAVASQTAAEADMAESVASSAASVADATESVTSGIASTTTAVSGFSKVSNVATAAFGKLKNVVVAHPFMAIAAAVLVAVAAIDKFTISAKEASEASHDKFNEISDVYSTTKSNISDMEGELSTINSQIAELEGKNLSFTDAQELERLKAQRSELENNLSIQEQLLEAQEKVKNEAAVAAMKDFVKASNEGAESAEKTGKAIGAIAGGLLAVGGIAAAAFTGGTSLVATVEGLGLMTTAGIIGGGAVVGATAGGVTASNVNAATVNSYEDWYKTYTEAYKKKSQAAADARKKYEKDPGDMDKYDEWQELEQEAMDVQSKMYDNLTQMQNYYSDIEYGQSEALDRELDTWYNFLDKMNVDQNGAVAKVNALDRIFGENASDEIKEFKKEIDKVIKNSDDEFDIAAEIEGRDELQGLEDQLAEIGITTDEVSDYFRQTGEIGTTAFSDLSGEIKEAKDAVTKLQAALDNNTNQGYETRNTAIEEMKHLMEEGIIGSESNLWNIAEAMGFTYDSAKSIEENADALYDYIEARDAWYEVDEDGEWGTAGADAFAKDIENAVKNSKKLQDLEVKWDFNEETGELNFDFNNMKFDEIVTALGETKEAAGLTNEEFIDMLTHLGQFYDVQWTSGNDVASYLEYLSTTGLSAKEQLDAVQSPLDQLLRNQGLDSDEIENYLTGNGSLKELPEDLQKAVGAYRDLHNEMEKETGKDESDDAKKSDKTSAVSDPVEDWLKNTLPNITNDISDFFTNDIPKFAGEIWNDIEEFFSTTLPEEWDEFWDNVGEFFDGIGDYASELWDSVVNFFTVTVPEEWNAFWDDVGEFIFETTPQTLGYLWESVAIFFNETLPHAWDDLWDEIEVFATETIPVAINAVGESIGTFFQETLPNIFNELWNSITEFVSGTITPAWNSFWDSVDNFITVTIPQAASELRDQIVHFFTSTLPEAANQLWGEIVTFVTETIPDAIDVIGEGIGTFFQETLLNALNELWNSIVEKFKEGIGTWWENFKEGRENKQEKQDKKNNGGKASGRDPKDPRVSINIDRVKEELADIDKLVDEDRQVVIDAVTKYKNGGSIDDLITDINSIEDKEVRKKVIMELEEEGALDELFTNLNWLDKKVVIKAITEGKGDVDELNRIIDLLPPEVQSTVRALVDDSMQDLEIVDEKLQKVDNTEATPDVSVRGADKAAKDADNVTDSVNNIPTSKNVKISAPGATGAKKDVDDLDDSVDNLSSTKTVTIWAQIRKKASDLWDKITGGGVGVNGTAHFGGTAHAKGTAYAGGNWGAPRTETALTGELGPELLVRNGRWTTIGENGAEFTEIKKGDIIFNHKQTEELLKNGYVTSGGGRGKAYAEGTAYAGGGGKRRVYTFTDDSVKKKNKNSNSSKNNSKSKKNSKDTTEEFEEVFDWFEVKIEEINEDLDLMAAKLENAITIKGKNNILDDMIKTNKSELTTLEKGYKLYNSYANDLIKEIPKKYREEAKNGKIAIEEFYGEVDEGTLEAIKNYREWAQKAADLKVQIQETKREIAELAKQKFDNISEKYDNIEGLQDNRQQHYVDMAELREDKGKINSGEYYKAAMKEEEKQKKSKQNEKKKLQASLDNAVKKGQIKKYSQEWYDMVNDIHAVDAEIDECTANIENYQNEINNIHFDNFEKKMSRTQYVADDLQDLIDLVDNLDESFDESGNWTDEGITKMGLYAQSMEVAQVQSQEYAEEIAYLKKNWKSMGMSYDEYQEKLAELNGKQQDAIDVYHDSKDAILEMQKARVDAIKNGIDEEIEAYEELIDKKKEELDAEKDLHDFQKNVMDQQKDIADIQRKLAALAGDNSAAAMAKRRQLEAKLAESKQGLEDTYYDRSIENKQTALDKQLEAFTKAKEEEKEMWDEWLKNPEVVLKDGIDTVEGSGDTVKTVLGQTMDEFGISIRDSIMKPWNDSGTALETTANKVQAIVTAFENAATAADTYAQKQINNQKEDNQDITAQGQRGKNNSGNPLKGVKVTAEKGTQLYDKNGNKIKETTGKGKNKKTVDKKVKKDTEYTAGKTNSKGMTALLDSKGNVVGYAKASDLDEKFKKGMTINADGAQLYDSADDKKGEAQNLETYTVLAVDNKAKRVKAKSTKKNSSGKYVTGWFDMSQVTITKLKDSNNSNSDGKNGKGGKDGKSGKDGKDVKNTKTPPKTGDSVTVDKTAKNYSSKSNNLKIPDFVKGGTYTVMQTSGSGDKMQVLIGKKGTPTGWVKLKDLKGYAKGSKSINKDQLAWLDELGEELQIVPNSQGRLDYVKKGTGIIPADMTERLMNLAMNPQDMLDRNRPTVGVSPEVHNTEINLNMQYGDMLRIENFNGDSPEDVAKIVAKQFEKHTAQLNQSLRKYVR